MVERGGGGGSMSCGRGGVGEREVVELGGGLWGGERFGFLWGGWGEGGTGGVFWWGWGMGRQSQFIGRGLTGLLSVKLNFYDLPPGRDRDSCFNMNSFLKFHFKISCTE